jgi:hypothetical protein
MSEVKVNKISPRSGTEVTLGDSGDTFTIPSGATINNQGTATNFGATGAASWNTTVKTGNFTAVAGEGYFVNTTSGSINVTLPAGTAGAVVAIKDYAGTFDTSACILVRNGSDKIGGVVENATLSTEGQAVTLVFVDSTQGWLVTDDGLQTSAPTATYITATGGTITNSSCGDFKIHTFTGPGTFTVCSVGNPAGSDTVSYVVVAGGGGSVHDRGGGGGAGGFRESKAANDVYTASPLNATSGPGYNLPVSATGFPITVGAGGTADNTPPYNPGLGGNGGNSIFSSITSTGGGGGNRASPQNGGPGGSGGGAGINPSVSPEAGTGGSGNTPPVSPPQGSNGGDSATSPNRTGGGGGATAVGQNGSGPKAGGTGATSSINGTPTVRAGGGGGISAGAAGPGGGGVGGTDCGGAPGAGGSGSANTGGGAGGGASNTNGGLGGSGIVIIRYKFQN